MIKNVTLVWSTIFNLQPTCVYLYDVGYIKIELTNVIYLEKEVVLVNRE
jgi:hypothetical protein